MPARSRTSRADRLIATVAKRQHGVVARRQLLGAGITRHQIAVRLASGRLHEVHHGVYLVGHAVPPPHAPETAALLACGGGVARPRRGAGAVLSHRSAGALWDLLPYPATAPVCVTVAPGRSAVRPRIEIHRATLAPRDRRRRNGLPLTSPARTILDLAARLDPEDLERVTAEASYRRLASEAELRDQLARNPRKPGGPNLRRMLELPGGAQRTRSPAERRMLRLLRRAGVTGYQTNAHIHGYEVDVLWRAHGFAVEIDGFEGHSGRAAFERDRLKVATLKAQGLDVMPVTPRQLRDDPAGVLVRLRAALELAGVR